MIHLHPDPDELVDLVRTLIRYEATDWKWNKVFIVYEAASGEPW